MELKRGIFRYTNSMMSLLIVPYGIETGVIPQAQYGEASF